MKLKLQKIIGTALVVMMLLSFCLLSPNAEALPKTSGEAIDLDETRDNSEPLNKNYESNIAYNAILKHIDAHDDELRDHFSGAYINDDGFLVVMLSCDTDSCKDYIVAELECDDVVFEVGTGSYYEGQRELDFINESIAALQAKIANGENVSDDAASLMRLQPRTSYNYDSNTVSVIFNMSEAVENAFMKSKGLEAGSTNQLSETEITALDEYYNAIRLFKSEISDSDTIEYAVCSDYEQIVEDTAA